MGIMRILNLLASFVLLTGLVVGQELREYTSAEVNNLTYGASDMGAAKGLYETVFATNKFGRAVAGLQTTKTDIWDQADATPTQQIWLAPTAARIHAIASDDAEDVGTFGILTMTDNFTDADTVNVAGKTYTFEDELTGAGDGNVHIAANISASIDNLIAAINLTTTDSTDFSYGTTAHPVTTILATIETGDLMNLYANTNLAAGDTLATETSTSDGSWGDTTMQDGTGAQEVKVYGLKTWDLAETNETVYLRGAFPVNTVNSYVIIHRMKVVTWADSVNVGNISATAATDATVTAEINAGEGQTQMAIYGVPSTETVFMTQYYSSINKSVNNYADISLLVNPRPDVEETQFLTKHTQGMASTGTSYLRHEFHPYFKIVGPAIIKMQGVGNASDIDASAGFDMIRITN